jgi:hypothetical protein
MFWVGSEEDEEEQNLLFSPALMSRRASESWIDTPPIEVPNKILDPRCHCFSQQK